MQQHPLQTIRARTLTQSRQRIPKSQLSHMPSAADSRRNSQSRRPWRRRVFPLNRTTKKRKLKDGSAVATGEGKGKESAAAKPRQNSVWVGNMSFKTTQENLKAFFAGVGEITRINMPMKVSARPNMPQENRGLVPFPLLLYLSLQPPFSSLTIAFHLLVFCVHPCQYTTFSPSSIIDSHTSISRHQKLRKPPSHGQNSLSLAGNSSLRMVSRLASSFTAQYPIDQRIRHIGSNFDGRPIAPGSDVKTTDNALAQKVHSKTAQKILRKQKQPPAPTLFVGNLPFETTEEDIRNLFREPSSGCEGREEREGEEEFVQGRERRRKGRGEGGERQ
ncbi:hypothetical protein DFP72DRAFT_584833 [Ephemerocybe angulata]|uniref:RRM domain-containing protein n=1 Tax=Ephemerocybe angulata TaxID=980116 RepID=A0A8H6HK85_9AGAR|nr:hypothetical protein DFP72DRAFT_584833 [Tulosesus angulatus]